MQRVRIFFTKRAEAAYISHLDLQRVMARALRRSGMPVWYSQGFNPHIYLSFALPLPLMQESEAESVDCRLAEGAEVADLMVYRDALDAALPSGIDVLKIAEPVYDADKVASAQYEIRWPGQGEKLQSALESYAGLAEAKVIRKTKRKEVEEDLKQYVPRLEPLGEDGCAARFPAGSELNLNPALLTGFMQEQFALPAVEANILRKQVYITEGEIFR